MFRLLLKKNPTHNALTCSHPQEGSIVVTAPGYNY